MNLRNAFPGQLLASGPCTPGGQEVASSNLVAPIEKAVLRAAFSIEQVSSREEKNYGGKTGLSTCSSGPKKREAPGFRIRALARTGRFLKQTLPP